MDKALKDKFEIYRVVAKRNNIDFQLTIDEFSTFNQKPCHYCKSDVSSINIDRLDRSLGYIIDNVRSCCTSCQNHRGNLSLEEWKKKLQYLTKCISKMLSSEHQYKATIAVDIDDTICYFPPDVEYITPEGRLDYRKAVPIQSNIDKLNEIYETGSYYILYYTARGATTLTNWTNVTKDQLESWGVKYHELRLDKPFFNYIIDDKAVNARHFDNLDAMDIFKIKTKYQDF